MPRTAIVVAIDSDGGFGKDGRIPWHIPEDFKHFKKITSGGACVMGRTTYEEIMGFSKGAELLPGRECFVVSNTLETAEKATVIRSVTEVFDKTQRDSIFFIGGREVFKEALGFVDEVHITNILGQHGCDVFFPLWHLQCRFHLAHIKMKDTLNFQRWEPIPPGFKAEYPFNGAFDEV